MQACRWTIVDVEGIVGDAGETRRTMMILFRNKRTFPFVDGGAWQINSTLTTGDYPPTLSSPSALSPLGLSQAAARPACAYCVHKLLAYCS